MPIFVPSSERDLRLDLFRGLANWAIFLGHIPDTALAWLTTRNYGFSDGADLFVFISGYTATLVFGKMMAQRGFVIGATRLFRRVWQLYVAHALLFLFYLTAVHYLAHRFNISHLMDEFNVARLMDFPVETLTEGLILKFKPLNLDVLPLYIVLMGLFPPVLWLMIRHRNWAMLASIALYIAARHFHVNLPSYPSGEWFFNPFTWQLLFVLGAWLAAGGARTDTSSGGCSSPRRCQHIVSAFRSCGDLVGPPSRLAEPALDRPVRTVHPERQDQSGAVPNRTSFGFGAPGR